MKIPDEILNKAFEGGYPYRDDPFGNSYTEQDHNEIILDPLFFQALGKALGWQDLMCMLCRRVHGMTGDCDAGYVVNNQVPIWRIKAQDYFDLVLTGGDLDAFWKGLLNEKV